MKLVIDIDEETYNEIMDDAKNTPRNLSHYERIIAKGNPIAFGDEISRKEAILQIQRYGVGCFDSDEFSPEQCERFVINRLNSLPSVNQQESKYCERNICFRNEYNGIGCDECEVTKSQKRCNDAISKQTAIDLEELRHRFGSEVAFVVEDMVKGTNERCGKE